MNDPRDSVGPPDPEFEARIRASFARADPPGAPESVLAQARTLAEGRPEPRRPLSFGTLRTAFALMAVVLSVSLVTAVLSTGRHSTTQGEGEPSATEPADTPVPSESRAPTASVSPSPEPTPAPESSPRPVPPAAGDRLPLAGWDVPAQVRCGGAPFEFDGLWSEPGAERRVGPEFDVLRSLDDTWMVPVRDPINTDLSYWEARRTDDAITFLALGGDVGWIYVDLQRTAAGWEYAGVGDCEPVAYQPLNYGVAQWQLDPAFREPGPSTTRLHLLVTEERCSRRPALGRISPAYVFPEPDEIRIQLFVEDPGRSEDCQHLPAPSAVSVELPEPLADRKLVDGNNDPCPGCGG